MAALRRSWKGPKTPPVSWFLTTNPAPANPTGSSTVECAATTTALSLLLAPLTLTRSTEKGDPD
ncbi:hypothetical protein GOP47_0011260 [Adiantum capillus-veneris]|uniref:Uncharacterized protein n=1 Tax=Adiantum capillus-veneris TaxID=13818 RepID=A0A9D4USW3_ADICA|nr:hypothetical protein GOP47_0011260 [Adiantum capillus-veneris]